MSRLWNMTLFPWLVVFALLIGFQNCSPKQKEALSNTPSSNTSRQANGGSYDGKLVILSPSHMSPGESVFIYVRGNEGSIQLTSNVPNSTIIEQSSGVYSFTIPSNYQEPAVQLVAQDQTGNYATATIRIWGINNWFFKKTTGVDCDDQGNLYIVENERPGIAVLNSEGEYLSRITNDTSPNLNLESPKHISWGSNSLVALENSSGSQQNVLVIDPVTKALQYKIEPTNQNPLWLDCGNITDMDHNSRSELLIACRDKVFHFSASGSRLPDLDLREGSQNQIQNIEWNFNNELIVVRAQGIIQNYGSNESLQSEIQIDAPSDKLNNLVVADYLTLSENEALYLSDGMGSAIDRQTGQFTQKTLPFNDDSDQSIYLGLGNSFCMTKQGQVVHTTDMNNVVVSGGDDLNYSHHFGPASSDLRSFYFPKAIHIDSNDNVTIVDNWNYRITRLNQQGEVLLSRQVDTSESYWIKEAQDIAMDRSGNTYVLDPYNNRIILFRTEGSIESLDQVTLDFPSGIHIYNDQIFVADSSNHRIVVLDLLGRFLYEISEGLEEATPQDVIATESEIYVLHGGANRISIHSRNGTFLRDLMNIPNSSPNAPFRQPQKFVLDLSRGVFYVTDHGSHHVVALNLEGSILRILGEQGDNYGQFMNPTSIAIDSKGFIYVTDTGNSRIQILPPLIK